MVWGSDCLHVVCCRWKGENVATSEVADILTMVRSILEANVYGVKVEGKHTEVTNIHILQIGRYFAFNIYIFFNRGHEGRVGMAAVTLEEGQEFDCTDTYKQVMNFLPAYARPRFIRIQVLNIIIK